MRYIVLTKKSLSIIGIAAIAVVVSLVLILTGDKAIFALASNKKLPIYCTEQKEKIVSLSFDAAWGAEDTHLLIDILGRYKVKATFFVVGQWVDKFPEEVKALSAAGHEIQNHSATHPHMPRLSAEKQAEEIKICNDKIEALTGKRPILFRPPYGDYNNTLIDTLTNMGMYCIQWDVDSLDWKDKTADQIYDRVTKKAANGSIVLFHNAAKNTPAALPKIIEKLQSDGFKLVPVSQQIHKGNYEIDHEGRQIPVTTGKLEEKTVTTTP
ncbi:MAG: deacetylase [Clostridiales bacterium 43-6]|nr:MAG: deacetylase [Clostridiales bacterium 43-6]